LVQKRRAVESAGKNENGFFHKKSLECLKNIDIFIFFQSFTKGLLFWQKRR